jgi:hypothetical protein
MLDNVISALIERGYRHAPPDRLARKGRVRLTHPRTGKLITLVNALDGVYWVITAPGIMGNRTYSGASLIALYASA